MTTQEYLSENELRKAKLFPYYSPVTGEGSPIPRFAVRIGEHTTLYIPNVAKEKMPWLFKPELCENLPKYCHKHNYDVSDILLMIEEVRYKCDFEFWAYKNAVIKDKRTGKDEMFTLNHPQRKIHAVVHEKLFADLPVRIDLLKCRKFGGSTYIQILFAWIQNEIKHGWNSCIVTDVESQARGLRAMTTKFAKHFPPERGTVTLTGFEGATKNKYIVEKDCTISIGSMQKPDSLRSGTTYLEHLSEVGLWKATPSKKPEDLIQTLLSMVMAEPWTCIFRESTAKGVGNYFHRVWLESKAGKSTYTPVFIPWYVEETNMLPIKDYDKFIASFSEYEKYLWSIGACLEGIMWYRTQLSDYAGDHWRMMSENPTTDVEAFQSTGSRTFRQEDVMKARAWNHDPIFVGDIVSDAPSGVHAFDNIRFEPNPQGPLKLWAFPSKDLVKTAHRYVISMDIGGRWDGADYSVIRVLDREPIIGGGVPEAILTYSSHIDFDLLAWKGAMIATAYDKALFVVESNSQESDRVDEGDQSLTILKQIAKYYDNLYTRTSPEKIREGRPIMWGFQTNRKTKSSVISTLNAAFRDYKYLECDASVLDEADNYETKTDGRYGAVDGQHDDKLMSTAIMLEVSTEMPRPYRLEEVKQNRTKAVAKTEAVL